jgi:hypothetical protein
MRVLKTKVFLPARNPTRVGLLVCFFLVLVAVQVDANVCPEGNLLLNRNSTRSRGVADPALLTDGWLVPESHHVNAVEATKMKGLRPFVQWDLGKEYTITAVAIQADGNDQYRLLGSTDNQHFEPIWEVPRVQAYGITERITKDLEGRARYIRFKAGRGDAIRAATEVRVFCSLPTPWPPSRLVSAKLGLEQRDPRFDIILNWQLVLSIFSLAMLFWVVPIIRSRRWKKGTVIALIVLSAASWTKFGGFNVDTPLHVWDSMHYFVSTKYFPELGYYELYQCIAQAEREAGKGDFIDNVRLRNLRDNVVHPGTWTRTEAGRCHAPFTPERWEAFKADIGVYQQLFSTSFGGWTLYDSFSDHGYNGTPVHTAWLRGVTRTMTATKGNLLALAQLDTLALILSVVMLWWAFGPITAGAAAIFIGFGSFWSYHWIGGSVGRFTWFFLACAGMALLKKEKPFWGAFTLTLSGLIRLHPLVFVGALGLHVLTTWAKSRRLSVSGKNTLLGIGLALVIGIGAGGMVNGFKSYRDFQEVATLHGDTLLSNHLGFPVLLGWSTEDMYDNLKNNKLSDSSSNWIEKHKWNQRTRYPIKLLLIAMALALIVFAAMRGAPDWQCVAIGGPLLFFLASLTAYDYIWIGLLLPLGVAFPKRQIWILLFVVLSLVLSVFVPDFEKQHLTGSFLCFGLLMALSVDVFREYRGLKQT